MNNKEKKTHSMKARGMISDVIVHVVLALLAIVWVIPVLWIALLSFSTQRSEEHTNSSHQIISYSVFCLKKKNCPL